VKMMNGILVCGFIFAALCLLAYTVADKTKVPLGKEKKEDKPVKLIHYE
jgi:hypothetical protein